MLVFKIQKFLGEEESVLIFFEKRVTWGVAKEGEKSERSLWMTTGHQKLSKKIQIYLQPEMNEDPGVPPDRSIYLHIYAYSLTFFW